MALTPINPYRKEKEGWVAVPQFGGWDQKAGGGTPDYSMVFTHARAKRKQQKVEVSSSSLGHEREFLNFPHPRTEQNSTMKKWRFFSCLSCGVKD
ncbi:uncharacterized protein LOC110026483 [Phalaenopsis equestris]|uniref:uncharacterized protein LOC110026483 n=1 Tax=Phalaenopsis equestris TaxID=78828 RepID=UPI0009E375FD|nr:uncharacterized protein LOC110026483 [Phalaenopsis equestris]